MYRDVCTTCLLRYVGDDEDEGLFDYVGDWLTFDVALQVIGGEALQAARHLDALAEDGVLEVMKIQIGNNLPV